MSEKEMNYYHAEFAIIRLWLEDEIDYDTLRFFKWYLDCKMLNRFVYHVVRFLQWSFDSGALE